MRLSGFVASLFLVTCSCVAQAAVCGDRVVDTEEECDDGGICIGGTNAGEHCSSEGECDASQGVCEGGSHFLWACNSNEGCPESRCVHCKTFGGDGCAANCTAEYQVPVQLGPGLAEQFDIRAGTSGGVIYGELGSVPMPYMRGTEILTAGRETAGAIPFVVKAQDSNLTRFYAASGQLCFCLRRVPLKTCGGTLYEVDGRLATDCTDDYTPGSTVCTGRGCAFPFGEGNASTGTVACTGGNASEIVVHQDCGIGKQIPTAPQASFAGDGARGTSFGAGTMALGTALLFCSGTSPFYGPDGEFCTHDDPISSRGHPITRFESSGTVQAVIEKVNDAEDHSLTPPAIAGAPFVCSDGLLTNQGGPALASAFTACDQPTFGDIVGTSLLVYRPYCEDPGDCDFDCRVTIDEVLMAVLDALYPYPAELRCPPADQNGDGAVTIDEIIVAVHRALDGRG